MSEDRGPIEVLLEDITGRLFRLQEKRSTLLASIRAIEPEMLDLLRREQELLKVLVRLKQVETPALEVKTDGRYRVASIAAFDCLKESPYPFKVGWVTRPCFHCGRPIPMPQDTSRKLYAQKFGCHECRWAAKLEESKPPAPEAEGFVARKVYAPAAEVESKYGLPPGTLLPDAKKELPAPEANAVITRQFPAEMAEEIKKQFGPLLELIVGPVDLAPEAETDEPQRINWKEFLG